MNGDLAYTLAKKYVAQSLEGAGALKGEDGYSPEVTLAENTEDNTVDLSVTNKSGTITKTLSNLGKADVLSLNERMTYNATDYGITTDSEDNSEKLQALIDKLYDLGGGTIYIPNGTYKFNMLDSDNKCCVSVLPNVSIVGQSKEKTVLKMLYNDVAYCLFRRTKGKTWGIKNVTYKNFTVDANDCTVWNTCAKAFYIQYMENCTFEDLILIGTPATALGVDMLYQCIINKVTCIDCGKMYTDGKNGTSGIGIGCGGYEHENTIITNCICVGSGQFGIFIEEQAPNGWGGEYEQTKGFVISNNIVHGGIKHGIGVRGCSNVVISNNTVYENTKSGIFIDGGYNINIVGNMVQGNNNGIELSPECTDIDTIMITNNLVSDNIEFGVLLNNVSTSLNMDNISIISNYTKSNGSCGLRLDNLVLNNYALKGNTWFDGVSNEVTSSNGKIINDTDDSDIVVLELLTTDYDAKCVYKLDSVSSYKYKMILLLSGSYYLYASNSKFYIYADESGNYYETYRSDNQTVRCTTSVDSCGNATYQLATESNILDTERYGYISNKRTLEQFVWSNHNLLQYGTDTVLVTAGLHE